jgi:hypothetical protein
MPLLAVVTWPYIFDVFDREQAYTRVHVFSFPQQKMHDTNPSFNKIVIHPFWNTCHGLAYFETEHILLVLLGKITEKKAWHPTAILTPWVRDGCCLLVASGSGPAALGSPSAYTHMALCQRRVRRVTKSSGRKRVQLGWLAQRNVMDPILPRKPAPSVSQSARIIKAPCGTALTGGRPAA